MTKKRPLAPMVFKTKTKQILTAAALVCRVAAHRMGYGPRIPLRPCGNSAVPRERNSSTAADGSEASAHLGWLSLQVRSGHLGSGGVDVGIGIQRKTVTTVG